MAMAMADVKGSMDYWRRFFGSAKCNIFELINKAILVASVDRPKEFIERRNLIAEKLYSSQLSLDNGDDDDDDDDAKKEKNSSNSEREGSNEIVGEVMRLKKVLSYNQNESDSVLYESLRTLQLMQLSVEILKATEIGRTVNSLRKHNSEEIRNLVRILIKGWKVMVDEWIKSSSQITKNTATDSVIKPNKSSATDSGIGCSSKLTSEQKPSSSLSGMKRKSDEISYALKVEITRRKLHEGYQRIENEKRQRRIQFIEPCAIPKESHEKRRSRKKP